MRVLSSLTLSLGLAASTAFAMGGDKPEPPTASTPSVPASGTTSAPASGPRVEAEQSYALAYEEVAKAKKEVEAGKTKNAEKKFKRALERAEKSTALDAKYHEAWNLVGYCARKLGDYPKAFTAYEKALEIKPDYAPAREYLGEAHLEQNAPAKAREQLALLERMGATEESKVLRAAIDAYVQAHPEAKEAPSEATSPVVPDTTAKAGQ